jgi:hypothetical protein
MLASREVLGAPLIARFDPGSPASAVFAVAGWDEWQLG